VPDTQVVIVGGGPVAMTAALTLAGFGVSSLMLEANRERDPVGSKALCMQRDVLDILDRLGVADPLVDEGVTWSLGRTYYAEHELFQISFPEDFATHFPPFVNIGQDRTEHWLEQRVDTSDATELRYGHEVSAIERDDGVTITAATEEGEVTVSGEYAIGADGARSTTRHLLDIDFPGESFEDQFLICDIRAELPFAEERRFFFDPEWNPDRQVLIHPQAGSVWRIDWQVPPDFDLDAEQATGGLEARIRKIVGGRPYEIVWMSVYRFHQRIADRFSDGRCFLAGDAAHLMAPFGARGLNSGIQDAENLAWKLAYVLRGWSPASLMATYEEERRAAAAENLRVTGATMRFLVPGTAEERRRRTDVLEGAVTNEEARRLVDSGRLAEPFVYVDSPLTTSRTARQVLPGALCPDVELPGGGWLRRRFGHGLVLLTSGEMGDVGGGVPGPIDRYDLDRIDPSGSIAAATGATSGNRLAVVVRPDGHIAAVVDDQASIAPAAARAVGVAGGAA
jgi:3-(3-hydroxy-phenyl)propionate hydroxylase